MQTSCFSAAQWALAEDLVKVLHPFEVATTVMSAEYNVSLSCVLPIMDGLYKGVSPSTDDLQATVLLKEILQKELDRKFCLQNVEPDSLPVLAFLLDPRFKSIKFVTHAVRAQAQDCIYFRMKKFSATFIPI